MRYGDLTYLEIAELAEAGWIAVVPMGCTQQQGAHLPTDLDTYWVTQACEAISNAASEREGIDSLVVPALPFGPKPDRGDGGSGSIGLPQDLHEGVVFAILESLAGQGFQRLVVVTGNDRLRVEAPIERMNEAHVPDCVVARLELPLQDIWCQLGNPRAPGGQADRLVTSIALYLRPGSVRSELIRDPRQGAAGRGCSRSDSAGSPPSGVTGDAVHASAALGKRLWEAVIDAGVAGLKEIAADGDGVANHRGR